MVIWARLEGDVFDVYEILPGFLVNCGVIIRVSLLGKPPAMAIRQEFARV